MVGSHKIRLDSLSDLLIWVENNKFYISGRTIQEALSKEKKRLYRIKERKVDKLIFKVYAVIHRHLFIFFKNMFTH